MGNKLFYNAFITCLILVLSFGGCTSLKGVRPATSSISKRLIAAHRGCHDRSTADNSLAALSRAGMRGVGFIEFDIRASLSGELFVFHDKRVRDREASAPHIPLPASFSSLASKQIRSLRRTDYKQSKVVSLKEALRQLAQYESLLLPEPKEATRDSIIRLAQNLRATKVAQRTVIQCLSAETFALVRANASDLKVLVRATKPEQITALLSFHPAILQIDEQWLTQDIVIEIRKSGALSLVKILDGLGDTAEHRERLFTAGVDIVLTDHPPQCD